jgi:hypothetical protein
MQPVIRTSRRLGSILHEVAQNFEVVSNIATILKSEINNVLKFIFRWMTVEP